MDIKSILKSFTHASLEDYTHIVEQCDRQIKVQKDNAEAYYFRAMAKMGIAVSLTLDNKLLFNDLPLGIAGGLGNVPSMVRTGNTLNDKMKKFEEHYKIADSAVEDYNKAIFMDKNIQKKYDNIKVKASSDFTSSDFIFLRPIPSKELVDLLAGNKKWKLFAVFLAFWFLLPFILLYFYGDNSGNFTNTGLFIELVYSLCLIFYALFANNKDSNILQKYGKAIIVIKKSNNKN